MLLSGVCSIRPGSGYRSDRRWARVIAIVATGEHILKSRGFLYATSWLRHYREIPSRLKKSYLRGFSKSYPRIAEYITLARVYRELQQVVAVVESLAPYTSKTINS
ncbi:MAG: hypothetical protein QXG81_05420 [Ignisphaera sp.]